MRADLMARPSTDTATDKGQCAVIPRSPDLRDVGKGKARQNPHIGMAQGIGVVSQGANAHAARHVQSRAHGEIAWGMPHNQRKVTLVYRSIRLSRSPDPLAPGVQSGKRQPRGSRIKPIEQPGKCALPPTGRAGGIAGVKQCRQDPLQAWLATAGQHGAVQSRRLVQGGKAGSSADETRRISRFDMGRFHLGQGRKGQFLPGPRPDRRADWPAIKQNAPRLAQTSTPAQAQTRRQRGQQTIDAAVVPFRRNIYLDGLFAGHQTSQA